MPTHQMAQTMTGAMFFSGLCTPKRPAATTTRKSATASVRQASRKPGASEQTPAGGARQIQAPVLVRYRRAAHEDREHGERHGHREPGAGEVERKRNRQVVARAEAMRLRLSRSWRRRRSPASTATVVRRGVRSCDVVACPVTPAALRDTAASPRGGFSAAASRPASAPNSCAVIGKRPATPASKRHGCGRCRGQVRPHVVAMDVQRHRLVGAPAQQHGFAPLDPERRRGSFDATIADADLELAHGRCAAKQDQAQQDDCGASPRLARRHGRRSTTQWCARPFCAAQ